MLVNYLPMTNKTIRDLAATYDAASLAYDRNPTDANRLAKNEAHTALLLAQRVTA